MAGGLFAVYRDTPAAQPAPHASRHSSSSSASSTNKATSRRKEGSASSRDHCAFARGLQEKENADPFAFSGSRGAGLAKGKKPPMVAKAVDGGKPVKGEKAYKPAQSRSQMSTNGICTGTLRTRVLPSPPLAPAAGDDDPIPSVDLSTLAPAYKLPSVVEISRSASPVPSLAPTSCTDSPASAVDSGYARSSRANDTDLDLDDGLTFEDESDVSAEIEEATAMFDSREADRRARALTESPLAEITQAFTGLGGFSVPPDSPTPAQTTFNRGSLAHNRSSPTKLASISSLPPRNKPYSTNATTKKVKPGQAAPAAPRAAPPRSLRV
ncbi:hypothetical protein JCM1841_003889 [Sporobolomyces salmonicolor]